MLTLRATPPDDLRLDLAAKATGRSLLLCIITYECESINEVRLRNYGEMGMAADFPTGR